MPQMTVNPQWKLTMCNQQLHELNCKKGMSEYLGFCKLC